MCKSLKIDPHEYLTDVLERVSPHADRAALTPLGMGPGEAPLSREHELIRPSSLKSDRKWSTGSTGKGHRLPASIGWQDVYYTAAPGVVPDSPSPDTEET